jgi:hypothetical protein
MAKTGAKIIGAVLFLLGLLGFLAPNFMGLHLNALHNYLNILIGSTALYFGFTAPPAAARLYCLVIGFIFGVFGALGFLLGSTGTSLLHIGAGTDEALLLRVLPGTLEFGVVDHILHILLSAFFSNCGLLTRMSTSLNDPELKTGAGEQSTFWRKGGYEEEQEESRPTPTPVRPTVAHDRPVNVSQDVAYDVFISYRRRDGSESARLIRGELRSFKLKVFLDVDDLSAGYFDEAILKCIEKTSNFIIILSPDCLRRCDDENDWFRKEIAQAIKTKRNIIPLLMPGFEFPPKEALPEEIRGLRVYQSVPYSHDFFDAMMDKLRRYLQK